MLIQLSHAALLPPVKRGAGQLIQQHLAGLKGKRDLCFWHTRCAHLVTPGAPVLICLRHLCSALLLSSKSCLTPCQVLDAAATLCQSFVHAT